MSVFPGAPVGLPFSFSSFFGLPTFLTPDFFGLGFFAASFVFFKALGGLPLGLSPGLIGFLDVPASSPMLKIDIFTHCIFVP